MSELKSRVKVKVTGFGLSHSCVILGQVKIRFFYETVYQREVIRGGTELETIIERAKEAIAAFKAAGFNEQGEIAL